MKYFWAGLLLALCAGFGASLDHYGYRYWESHNTKPSVSVAVIEDVPDANEVKIHAQLLGILFFYSRDRNAAYATIGDIGRNQQVYLDLASEVKFSNGIHIQCPVPEHRGDDNSEVIHN